MTSNSTAAIVVGVDGSEQSLHALDWAAQDAPARGDARCGSCTRSSGH